MNTREVAKKMISKELFINIIDKISIETPVKNPTISLFDWGEIMICRHAGLSS